MLLPLPPALREAALLPWRVSVAATRKAPSGRVLAPQQRLTVEQGIRAQTLDAAYQLFADDRIGSIEVGKYADLVVLCTPLGAYGAIAEAIAPISTHVPASAPFDPRIEVPNHGLAVEFGDEWLMRAWATPGLSRPISRRAIRETIRFRRSSLPGSACTPSA